MAITTRAMFDEAYESWLKTGAVLNKLNRGAEIDEMALLFGSHQELDRWVKSVAKVAPEFNRVEEDIMHRMDRPRQRFAVEFRFLQQERTPYRLECMTALNGDAPLHARRLFNMGRPCVVHGSYKLNDIEEYEAELSRLRNSTNMMFAAEYQNSYGRFAYFRHFHLDGVYLKPRVNLRDGADT